jgi:acetyltransferase-like isoleucine patch superfamily enzyme
MEETAVPAGREGNAGGAEARRLLAEFLAGNTGERVFTHPIDHPANPTPFCYCDQGLRQALRFYLRASVMAAVFALPFSGWKVWVLRRFGARIGRRVEFSPHTWVDPCYPELITIEDTVLIGTGAKIFTHEYQRDTFRAGKVIIRSGALIGGFAVIRCGVEIGKRATIGPGVSVLQDVPSGATLVPAPARMIREGQAT